MENLSKSDLRTLYMRRTMLEQIVQSVALKASGDADASWKPELKRMQDLHKEIKSIVGDPSFDMVVPKPEMSTSGHTYSPVGTMANIIATGKELIRYVDGVLSLYVSPHTEGATPVAETPAPTPAKVFIGHGHNELVRHRVKGFVADRCGLEPIILEELPSAGMTVVEKLEKYGRPADYAVLILTGDDLAASSETQARQNVIEEVGWFQGALGRDRTAILVQEGTQIPSNIAGVVYIGFSGDEVQSAFDKLRAEFEEAGLLGPSS